MIAGGSSRTSSASAEPAPPGPPPCPFPHPTSLHFGRVLHFPSKSVFSLRNYSYFISLHFHSENSRSLGIPTLEIGSAGKARIANYSRITCSTKAAELGSSEIVRERSVSVILLAGGKGKRMGASMPKQYLPLLGQPIALYSFYTFSRMVEVKEIIVVCDPPYRDVFEDAKEKIPVDLKFALPGKERQDSVYSGLQAVDLKSELLCIHDSARPLVTSEDVKQVLQDGWLNGAAVLGVPVKATIKEANKESYVVRTLDRKTLWEMQTPQTMAMRITVDERRLEVTSGKLLLQIDEQRAAND